MFCENCGERLADDAMFCEKCGAKVNREVTEPDIPSPPAPSSPSPATDPTTPMTAPMPTVTSPATATGVTGSVVTGNMGGDTKKSSPYKGRAGRRVSLTTGMMVILATVCIILVGIIVFLVTRGGSVQGGDSSGSGIGLFGGGSDLHDGMTYEEIAEAVDERDAVEIEYVSADVSDYPTVKAYFAVLDEYGDEVTLNNPVIAVKERIANGKELERTVKSFAQLDGREGISFDIVMDKSGSMNYDLPEVKSILSEFARALDYDHGDEAEIIAFDSYVMYMCTYTKSESQLVTGINNMEAYGSTALYDALYDAVMNAGNRKGARCVIAFTDGDDNSSYRSLYEVEELAEDLSVPVYIIGTYALDGTSLGNLAYRTGGQCWDISDITDMADILDDISAGERKLYCIEYESDGDKDADAERTLACSLADASYGCTDQVTFSPNIISGVAPHESRYEVVKQDISWTDANSEAIRKGGHLVTINSQDEMDRITQMVEAEDLQFVWMGGYTSTRGSTTFGHWVTGEPFSYESWYPGEPSRNDLDGVPEMYLMLWRVKGVWSWNDERNKPYEDSEMQYMRGRTGYVIEYEDSQ